MSCIVTLGCAGFKCYCTWSHQLGVGNSGGHSATLPPGGAMGRPSRTRVDAGETEREAGGAKAAAFCTAV